MRGHGTEHERASDRPKTTTSAASPPTGSVTNAFRDPWDAKREEHLSTVDAAQEWELRRRGDVVYARQQSGKGRVHSETMSSLDESEEKRDEEHERFGPSWYEEALVVGCPHRVLGQLWTSRVSDHTYNALVSITHSYNRGWD